MNLTSHDLYLGRNTGDLIDWFCKLIERRRTRWIEEITERTNGVGWSEQVELVQWVQTLTGSLIGDATVAGVASRRQGSMRPRQCHQTGRHSHSQRLDLGCSTIGEHHLLPQRSEGYGGATVLFVR